MTDSSPPRSAHYPPGYDEADPYADEDLDSYPEWWKRNIERFREHGMRPYRPPRFAEGELTPEVIHELEDELDVTIRIRSIDPHTTNDWQIWVEETPTHEISRVREPEGFSRYDIDADEFEKLVRREVAKGE